MSAADPTATREFTVRFPEELARQVVAVADAEKREISEIFGDAFRGYRSERIRCKLEVARAEAARRYTHSYSEDDVEDLVDEVRGELYAESMRKA
jgi:hypothetical protein